MSGWQGTRGTRHERGYGASWTALRLAILSREKFCQPCLTASRLTLATQVDHITPKAKGGDDDPANLQSICADCHATKTAAEAAEAQGRTVKPTIGADGWPVAG